jgi:hypothetical protein
MTKTDTALIMQVGTDFILDIKDLPDRSANAGRVFMQKFIQEVQGLENTKRKGYHDE